MKSWAEGKLLYTSQSDPSNALWSLCTLGKANCNHTLISGMGQSGCPKGKLTLSFNLAGLLWKDGVPPAVKTQKIPRLHAPETCMRNGQADFATKTTELRCVRPVVW